MNPEFLEVEDVLDIHEQQLAEFGGFPGLRDEGLLASAVAQRRATFGGEYVHDGLFKMAAAYLFHLVQNHPFFDGNKRTGLLSALVFLDLNGIALEQPVSSLYKLTMAVAESGLDKKGISLELRSLAGA